MEPYLSVHDLYFDIYSLHFHALALPMDHQVF